MKVGRHGQRRTDGNRKARYYLKCLPNDPGSHCSAAEPQESETRIHIALLFKNGPGRLSTSLSADISKPASLQTLQSDRCRRLKLASLRCMRLVCISSKKDKDCMNDANRIAADQANTQPNPLTGFMWPSREAV